MKSRIFLGVSVIGAAAGLHASESFENAQWESCEKTYVSKNEMHFAEHAIFVHVNKQWLETPAIHADNHGFYIDQLGYKWSWTCTQCNKRNEAFRDTCKRCGAPRPD